MIWKYVLLLVLAALSVQDSISVVSDASGDGGEESGEDTAPTPAIAVSTPTACGEVFEPVYVNNEPLTLRVPDDMACEATTVSKRDENVGMMGLGR